MTTTNQAENTDREIWRETPGDYYSPSIHVTQEGGIGINVGGHVIVMEVYDWHRLAVMAYEKDMAKLEAMPDAHAKNVPER